MLTSCTKKSLLNLITQYKAKIFDLAIKTNKNQVALLPISLVSLGLYGEVQDLSLATSL
jgi:hypothetical protein